MGVTNDLVRRIEEHRSNRGDCRTFAGRYYCYDLLYFEEYPNVQTAIYREKEIKLLNRSAKESLIKISNPEFATIKIY